jgi:L-ascorbate metabolism protein UlaG (beta-lactamase superfamily)
MRYASRQLIIDPYLADRHTMPSSAGISLNPLVDLPCPPLEALAGIDLGLISHLHDDHIDPIAESLLPCNLPLLCQPQDKTEIEAKGFSHVIPVEDTIRWKEIEITRTDGQHGTGEVLKQMGPASGFVFRAKNEPTVYWAGDTIWCKPVADLIAQLQPDIIITHSCGAMWGQNVLIVMDAAQTIAVCRAAPNSVVIATHMDALDHATVSRETLREYAVTQGIAPNRLLIPEDGEILYF